MKTLNLRQLDNLMQLEHVVNEAIVGELLRLFRVQLYDFIKTSRTYIKNNDLVALSRAAHTLKTSAGNLGMAHPASLCLALESACNSKQKIDFEKLVFQIETKSLMNLDDIDEYIKVVNSHTRK